MLIPINNAAAFLPPPPRKGNNADAFLVCCCLPLHPPSSVSGPARHRCSSVCWEPGADALALGSGMRSWLRAPSRSCLSRYDAVYFIRDEKLSVKHLFWHKAL